MLCVDIHCVAESRTNAFSNHSRIAFPYLGNFQGCMPCCAILETANARTDEDSKSIWRVSRNHLNVKEFARIWLSLPSHLSQSLPCYINNNQQPSFSFSLAPCVVSFMLVNSLSLLFNDPLEENVELLLSTITCFVSFLWTFVMYRGEE